MKIHINQVGYKPGSQKYAMISSDEPFSTTVTLENIDDSTSVELTVSNAAKDPYSGDYLLTVDFSQVQTKGRYRLLCKDCEPSPVFEIGDHVYANAARDLFRMFYFMRCGCSLLEKHAGIYKHSCCHSGRVLRYTDGVMLPPIIGGWHDAGDYGRYTSPGAVAAAHLMYAYELFPTKCPSLSIPESGNGTPDVLNECRYELEWLLKMQFEDGSASHKLTSERHAGFMMPEEDKSQFVLYMTSTMATADFAAVMALGARLFRRFDASFADRMQSAALRARDYLYSHPEMIGFTNPPGCGTGGYGDRSDTDERMWAFAEIYRLTKDARDLEMLTSLASVESGKTCLGWGQVGGLAGLCILFAPTDTFPEELCLSFRRAFLAQADRLRTIARSNSFRLAMPLDAFGWGSNMVVMDHAATLIVATLLSGKAEYASLAEDNVHYLLGRNPLDRSYITGHGSNPFKNPHNRPTASDGIDEPFPGLVSGGPNAHLMDAACRELIAEGTPPLRCHADVVGSYSTNEIAIYWNSVTALVFAYFS